jgi:hypothetical protein
MLSAEPQKATQNSGKGKAEVLKDSERNIEGQK